MLIVNQWTEHIDFFCLKYNGYWVLLSQCFELEIDFWNVTIFKSGCHRNDVNFNQLLTAGVNFIGFCDHWSIGIGKHCNSVYWFWHINRYRYIYMIPYDFPKVTIINFKFNLVTIIVLRLSFLSILKVQIQFKVWILIIY